MRPDELCPGDLRSGHNGHGRRMPVPGSKGGLSELGSIPALIRRSLGTESGISWKLRASDVENVGFASSGTRSTSARATCVIVLFAQRITSEQHKEWIQTNCG